MQTLRLGSLLSVLPMNPVYLSTGAFTGRINGRNPHLLTNHYKEINCDGFELMLFDDLYNDLDEILTEYKTEGINIPVIHADKSIGSLLSGGKIAEADELFAMNCRIANTVGAEKAVVHMWGSPDSDKYFEYIIEGAGKLLETSDKYGVSLLVENSFCHTSPIKNFKTLYNAYPSINFIVDTRCAQFHNEVVATCESSFFAQSVRHLHISDYKGGYMDWQAMYPVLHPGEGDVDWNSFFGELKRLQYSGSLTLESASMQEKGINAQAFNRSIDFIRKNL